MCPAPCLKSRYSVHYAEVVIYYFDYKCRKWHAYNVDNAFTKAILNATVNNYLFNKQIFIEHYLCDRNIQNLDATIWKYIIPDQGIHN